MNNADQNWRNLVKTARHAADDEALVVPLGFSTRVAARWLSGGRPVMSAWELLSLRSVGLALFVMVVSLSVSYSAVQEQLAPEPAVPADIVALLDE